MDQRHPRTTHASMAEQARRSPRARLALLVAIVAGGLLALAGCLVPGLGTIEGTVVDALGEGVEGLEVTLYAGDAEAVVDSTTTSADGSYAFEVDAAYYRIEVSDPGGTYLTTWHHAASSWATATSIAVNGGLATHVDDVVVTPLDAASIAGTVEDAEGDPIEGITVHLLTAEGRQVLDEATTSVSGGYQFGGLVPGSYKLELTDPAGTYGSVFGGGQLAYGQATTYVLGPGDSEIVDVTLDLAGSISGTITNGAGGLESMVVVLFSPASPDADVAVTITDAAGAFTFDGLGTGTYYYGVIDPLAGADALMAYKPALYNTSSVDFPSATPIAVAAGQDVVNRDLRLIGGGCDPSIMHTGADLSGADLSHRNVSGCTFISANLTNANATGSIFTGADIRSANFSGANLTSAVLAGSTFQYDAGNLHLATLTGADVSGLQLFSSKDASGRDYTGTNFAGARLDNNDFSGATFTGANVTGANLSSSDFTGVAGLRTVTGLSSARWDQAVLDGNDLSGVDFSGASMISASLIDADLSGVEFGTADIRFANFAGADLSDADLHETSFQYNSGNLHLATLTGADVSGLQLFSSKDASGRDYTGTNFAGARLDKNDFSGATFAGANVSGANLSSSDFTGAVGLKTVTGLKAANLSSTTLAGNDLSGIDLSGAAMNNVTATGANFTGTSLAGADLRNGNYNTANFTNADLDGALVTGSTFVGATWSNTICPSGINSDLNGGSCFGVPI